MKRKRKAGPRLLYSPPIEDRLAALEARATDYDGWGADQTAKTIRLCVAEIEDAMREAEDAWQSTAQAALVTGWDQQTLVKWARRKLAGETVPHEWRKMEVRGGRDAGGYSFRVSTVPPRPARAPRSARKAS